nr:glycosyltransferase [Pseudobutyrivibrio xylanivorans]
MDQFKDMLESIDEQEYREFELYILDDNPTNTIEVTIKEFFPDIVDKVHYRRLKKKVGGAYALNVGAHFAEGDNLVFIGQHDRLSYHTLKAINEKIDELKGIIVDEDGNRNVIETALKDTLSDNSYIIYADHDELIGLDRRNPHFKTGFNKELLLQTNYIGDFLCISKEAFKKLGTFNEKAKYAYVYEYLLRACFKKIPIEHIPYLLYHKRTSDKMMTKEERKAANYSGKEHLALALSYLRQSGVLCDGRVDPSLKKWHIEYDDSSFRRFSGDYKFIKEENVQFITRNNAKKMYAYLSQPDVAVVGIRFLGRGFTYDNAGYIVSEDGSQYPAFHGQRIFRDTYEGLGSMARDVSTVDGACCMIDAKVFRMLRGFDTSLTGEDALLDFCLRARARGFRTVVVPKCVARYKNRPERAVEKQEPKSEKEQENELENQSEEAVENENFGTKKISPVHARLMEKHGDLIEKGDRFYNKNLPLGMDNFILPGTGE